jgi:hypothetical protein
VCAYLSYSECSETRRCSVGIACIFALEYAIRKIQEHQEEMKLNGTYQLLVFTGDTLLVENIHTIKKNIEVLLISSKEVGPEVNTYKKKYMFLPRQRIQDRITT